MRFDRVRGVLDDRQPVSRGNRWMRSDVRGAAGVVHRKDRFRASAVSAASMHSGLMLPVCRSTSAKTGVAPAWMIVFAVAQKVSGVVMTSSPGPTPAASSDRCRAAVHEFTATAYGAPT